MFSNEIDDFQTAFFWDSDALSVHKGEHVELLPTCVLLTLNVKLQAAQEICAELGIDLRDVCFVGDDINDVELLRAVGYPCCPPNARQEVLDMPGIRVLKTPGGQGAIREITDGILADINRK